MTSIFKGIAVPRIASTMAGVGKLIWWRDRWIAMVAVVDGTVILIVERNNWQHWINSKVGIAEAVF